MIKIKCHNSLLIDIVALSDTNKNNWTNGTEISDIIIIIIAVFENVI